jgi:hypothetical protein
MRVRIAILLVVLGLLAFAAKWIGDKAENRSLDRVPKPALNAIKARFPGADLRTAFGIVKEAGKPEAFEVNFYHNGVFMSVIVTVDGTITQIEKGIAAEDVPVAVRKAIEAKYPRATWKDIKEATKIEGNMETVDFYWVEIHTVPLEPVDKKTLHLRLKVDPSGKIILERDA